MQEQLLSRLVCDNQFAMLGSHNFLSSKEDNDTYNIKEIGIYTREPSIIEGLKQRYDYSDTVVNLKIEVNKDIQPVKDLVIGSIFVQYFQ